MRLNYSLRVYIVKAISVNLQREDIDGNHNMGKTCVPARSLSRRGILNAQFVQVSVEASASWNCTSWPTPSNILSNTVRYFEQDIGYSVLACCTSTWPICFSFSCGIFATSTLQSSIIKVTNSSHSIKPSPFISTKSKKSNKFATQCVSSSSFLIIIVSTSAHRYWSRFSPFSSLSKILRSRCKFDVGSFNITDDETEWRGRERALLSKRKA